MTAIYEYRCSWCGPFETRASVKAAGAPAPCPGCDALSPRIYSAPGGRTPRRARQLDGVGRAGRERIERAETGVPRVGQPPPGRHVHAGGTGPGAGRRGVARPWQIGH